MQPMSNSAAEPNKWREFNTEGDLARGMSEHLAAVIRDYLQASNHPDADFYSSLPAERLVEQDDLILAVPDSIWQKHDFHPAGPWRNR